MSDLLAAAAAALKAPEAIVKRSAEARAKAGGMSTDEVLAAWAGGGSVATATPSVPTAPEAPVAATATAVETESAPAPETATEPVALATAIEVPVQTPSVEEPLDPVPLGERIKTAGKIGAWTGAVLGVIGAMVASPWLLTAASLAGSEGDYSPAVLVTGSRFVLATALLSVVFGLIVAAVSRTLTGWLKPGAGLTGRRGTTRVLGAGTGLVLGLLAGSVLSSGFGQPVEGSEGLVTLPVVSALIVVLIGGALLGWLTAALVQALAVPAALADDEADAVRAVKARLGGAIAVPVAAIIALGLLVLPFAMVLIRSNHMTSGGAAILAIIAAASILAVAGLSASRPGMKISRGEFLVALGGIGVVLLIIVAVFLARSGGREHAEEAAPTEAVAARVF